jgi:hypothetical protein
MTRFDTVWLWPQVPGGQPMESSKLPARVAVPPEIQELSRQIEEWRSSRPHRMRMPDPLWTLAANLARQYSVAQVSRFLRLDYYSLKERLEALDQNRGGTETRPTFIELRTVAATPVSECTIDLEHPQGRRMRIQVKGAALPDLETLTRTFWATKR